MEIFPKYYWRIMIPIWILCALAGFLLGGCAMPTGEKACAETYRLLHCQMSTSCMLSPRELGDLDYQARSCRYYQEARRHGTP